MIFNVVPWLTSRPASTPENRARRSKSKTCYPFKTTSYQTHPKAAFCLFNVVTNTAVAWLLELLSASIARADMSAARGKLLIVSSADEHNAVGGRYYWPYWLGSLVTSGPAIGCRWFGMHPTTGCGEERFSTGSHSDKVLPEP